MRKIFILVLTLAAFHIPASALTTKYLDINAAGTGTGADWTNAWTSFAAALAGCVTPAATDTVIVYVRDGTYIENTSGNGALFISGNFVNNVTFTNDPYDLTPNIVVTSSRTAAGVAESGNRVSGVTANLTFKNITFKNSMKAIHNCDTIAGWSDSATMTTSTNTTTFYEGTAALNLVKDAVTLSSATTSIATTAMYHDAGGNMSFSFYVKDAATLANLATSGCLKVRFGSDTSTYYEQTYNRADFAVGWTHIWGEARDSSVGSPTTTAMDTLEIVVTATGTGVYFVSGDLIIDDINSNIGSVLTLNYSATGVHISNLSFSSCTFDANRVSNYGCIKYSPSAVGTNTVSGLNFLNCTFICRTKNLVSGTLNGLYINATTPVNYVSNLVLRGCTFDGGVYGFLVYGAPNFKIQFCKTFNNPIYSFNIPATAATFATLGTDTYGVIEDSYFETTGAATHSGVIGTNLDNGNEIIVRRCKFVSPSSNGLVIKGAFNVTVESCISSVTTTGGAAIMFKGVKNGIARNNYIDTAGAGIGGSDAADYPNTNCRYYNNYVRAWGPTGRIFSFADHATQLGGNIVNYNAYDSTSSTNVSPYGTVGTDSTIASLAELKTAWAAYSASYSGNDANSITAMDHIDRFDSVDGRYFDVPVADGAIDIGTGLNSVVPKTMTDYYGRQMKLSNRVPIGHVQRVSQTDNSYRLPTSNASGGIQGLYLWGF